MNILKELDQIFVREFVQYLINNNYDYNKILSSLDLRDILFYILEFLNSKNIYILPNDLGYVVYIMENNVQRVISCEYSKESLAIKYIKCIKFANDFFINPF